MKILYLFPPNYKEINAAFNVRGKQVIFSYGDFIYNPSKTHIGPELIAHEEVHGRRQNGNPSSWWERYIDDKEFRLLEEIPAHRAEYMVSGKLGYIAERLSSSLYGKMISRSEAEKVILNG